jgi:hypothetical protein
MNIVFEKMTQSSGIFRRKFLRTGAGRGGSIKLTAAHSSSGAKSVEINLNG